MGAATSGTRRGNGAGWGGPAKGAGHGKRPAFTPDTAPRGHGWVVTTGSEVERKARDAERAALIRDHLYTLATTAERQEAQITASVAFLNRVEGLPVSRGELDVRRPLSDLKDDELARAIDMLRSAVAGLAGDDGAGAAPTEH